MPAADPDPALLERFLRCGIPEADARPAATPGNKVGPVLCAALDEAGCTELSSSAGALLYMVTTKLDAAALHHRAALLRMVVAGDLASNAQVDAALRHVRLVVGAAPEMDMDALRTASGVGVVVTDAQIDDAVAATIDEVRADLLERRYRFPLGLILRGVMQRQPWANGKVVKERAEAKYVETLGPKTDEDNKPLPPKTKAKKGAAAAGGADGKGKGKGKGGKDGKKEGAGSSSSSSSSSSSAAGAAAGGGAEMTEASDHAAARRFTAPHENTSNTPELLKAHLERTKSEVRTRFPPEPNGHLHIGHAKAMNLSFSHAMSNPGGQCVLRFDDTNPEGESTEFIDSIIDDIAWLGWKPARITYSSEYFPQLFDIALDLIDRGLAYCCHQSKEEIAKGRETKTASPWRDRAPEENRRIFLGMARGKYEEGSVSLRLKMDMNSDNMVARDPIAYRIKYVSHPHVGDRWCVYPTYDYTHCLVDSLEDITHSLCSIEFQTRHETYMSLLDMARMYKPVVWEFGRLSLSNTLMSKRKFKQLIAQGLVRGWDDPRLPTIKGFRRRGLAAAAINAFCRDIGVTRNSALLDQNVLDMHCRTEMNESARRAFCVLKPLKITLTNWDERKVDTIEAPVHPERPEMGTRSMPLSRTVFIDRDDFRLEDEKKYHGLAPGKMVRLRYAMVIRCDEVVMGDDSEPVELKCTAMPDDTPNPKGVLHWVSSPAPGVAPASAEVRLYDRLLTSFDPAELQGAADWLVFLNPESEVIVPGALVEPSVATAGRGARFQFERVGFFAADADSSDSRLVFNRTVTLKEAKDRKAIKK